MHFSKNVAALAACLGTASAWLPSDAEHMQPRRAHARDLTSKHLRAVDGTDLFERSSTTLNGAPPALKQGIRGVNIGSYLVFEPWIFPDQWSAIGCGSAKSEFDCGKALGQAGVNKAFQQHWSTAYTQSDIQQMVSLGLNTIRIPVGYWLYQDIVDASSEPFPQGGMQYLIQLCGWASDAGMYIIVDHHGAPGAQVANNADTGQYNPNPGFYDDYNYNRSYSFLAWMTQQIHTTHEMRNVGMLEILNEPEQGNSNDQSMRQTFYPKAVDAIRNAETQLNVPSANQLHIEMMNNLWGAGQPTQYLTNADDTNLAFDDHRYIKWAGGQTQTKDAYMQTSCNDNRGGNTPTVVGEWSLSAPLDDSQQNSPEWDPSQNTAWYLGWFAAQTRSYEKQYGWIFWTWKATLGDPRWSYTDAVKAGIIPSNLNDIYNSTLTAACNGF